MTCLLRSRDSQLLHSVPLGHTIRKLRFQPEYRYDNIDFQLLALTPNVEELIFYKELIFDDIEKIGRCCPQLLSLRLIRLNVIKDKTLEPLGRACPHLRQFSITGIHSHFFLDDHRITPSIFTYIKNCPLEKIEITHCHGLVTTQTATNIASFSKLTHLRLLENTPGIDEEFMQQLLPSASGLIPLPLLKVLHLQGGVKRPLVDTVLVPFIQSHPDLEKIRLYSWPVDDTVVMAVTKSLPSLKELCIVNCGVISPQAVGQLVRACPQLDTLYIPSCPLERYLGISVMLRHEHLRQKEINCIRRNIINNSRTLAQP